MAKKKPESDVTVYVVTVDNKSGETLRTEIEDPKTGERIEIDTTTQTDQQSQAISTGQYMQLPTGFIPSAVIVVGGGNVVTQQPIGKPPIQPMRMGPPNVRTPRHLIDEEENT